MTTTVLTANDSNVAPAVPVRGGFADLDALLAPISGEAPAGESLRYDPWFDRMREARREEDSSLPQGVWKRDLKRADWNEVHKLATSALTARTKDLQIAAWLLEAWIHQHGFAGARDGFALLLGLCKLYWADMYPLPDGEDMGARILTIEWVNERLRVPLESVPVTKPSEAGVRAWTWAERETTLERENRGRRASAPHDAADDGALTSVAFATSAGLTPREFYAECAQDLGEAIASVRALTSLLDERCGRDAPGLTNIVEPMLRVREWMLPLGALPAAVPVAVEPVSDPDGALTASLAGEPDVITHGGDMEPATDAPAALPIDHERARAEAYRKLEDAARTLMRIEPHSPTPYLVRRAIAWGGMSLAELMRHFIESGYDLKSLYSMLGMEEAERE